MDSDPLAFLVIVLLIVSRPPGDLIFALAKCLVSATLDSHATLLLWLSLRNTGRVPVLRAGLEFAATKLFFQFGGRKGSYCTKRKDEVRS